LNKNGDAGATCAEQLDVLLFNEHVRSSVKIVNKLNVSFLVLLHPDTFLFSLNFRQMAEFLVTRSKLVWLTPESALMPDEGTWCYLFFFFFLHRLINATSGAPYQFFKLH
jgi:hypothetical protein